jgi:hypothetical protein
MSTRGHKASSEEAFIITLTKLATGRTSTSLVEAFGAMLHQQFRIIFFIYNLIKFFDLPPPSLADYLEV